MASELAIKTAGSPGRRGTTFVGIALPVTATREVDYFVDRVSLAATPEVVNCTP